MDFPDGFLWGASTAAHQIEGGNVNSDWWQREWGHLPGAARRDAVRRRGGQLPPLSRGHGAARRRRARHLPVQHRVGPHRARGGLDLARRDRPLPADGRHGAATLGLQPMVTLHHFTNPVWFAREGGWHSDAAADRFARYVEAALPVLDDVDLVCTINEPNMVSVLADPEVGFPSIGLPPGVPAVTDRRSSTLTSAPSRSSAAPASGPDGRSRRRPTSRSRAPRRSPPSTAASREDVFLDAGAGRRLGRRAGIHAHADRRRRAPADPR